MRTTHCTFWLAAVCGTCAVVLAGCQPYQIEYRTRPAFYEQASEQPLANVVELEDGTRIVYRRPGHRSTLERHQRKDNEPTKFREEHEDGTVQLRSFIPHHVLANFVMCVRNEEYDLIYEQMLSSGARDYYEWHEEGFESFEAFMRSNRRDLLVTTNRMLMGLAGADVVTRPMDRGRTRLEFHPQIANEFRFTSIDMVVENGMLLLNGIE